MARTFEFPRPTAADFGSIRELLSANGLPASDLSLALLAHFRVHRDGERVVAVGGIELLGTTGLLRSVAVDPAYRATGIASPLVAALEREAARLGLDALYLLTTTAADFFARRGYVVVGRGSVPAAIRETAQFTQLCPGSATCMRKTLSA